jgi:hypothetical protein
LENGYVWIGQANLNPQTNPVVAYYDAALTIVAAQPLRTLNGYVSRAGTPAQVYIDGVNFSILVQDSNGSMVYNIPDATGNASDILAILAAPTGAGLIGTTDGKTVQERVGLIETQGLVTGLGMLIRNFVRNLAAFSTGGSYGIGNWQDGTAINQHAGDDGTTTRVCSVRAETAPLFLGITNRTNSEPGGPVGRTVASFEGYRLANTDGSRESGALRVITEGTSLTQLGARVSILTRRDGFTDADFTERFAVQNDGNVYQGGGPGGVGNANRSNQPYGNTVYTLSGQTGRSVFEMTTNAADADGVVIGDTYWLGNYQTDEKRIAVIQGVLSGTTATKRGGILSFYLKADNGALSERVRMTASGVATTGPIGTLQTAPTLTITTNNISPTAPISFLGAGLVKNLVIPAAFAGTGGTLTIIPTAAFTTDTTGNIAIASTAEVGRAITFTYDNSTIKWYPSY